MASRQRCPKCGTRFESWGVLDPHPFCPQGCEEIFMDSTIQVHRRDYTANSTGGSLFDPTGNFVCYTLEPSCNPLVGKPRAMPEGTYELVMQWSTEFKRDTPHYVSRDAHGNVVDVAGGHSYVEIHPGNFENATKDDSLDCLLVGRNKDVDYVGQSRDCFNLDVMPVIDSLLAKGRLFIQIIGTV